MNELNIEELTEAKQVLESEGYERRLVYKLTYQKDNTWKHIYFEDKDDAYAMVDAMQKINAKGMTYNFITVNKWHWEMFIEP